MVEEHESFTKKMRRLTPRVGEIKTMDGIFYYNDSRTRPSDIDVTRPGTVFISHLDNPEREIEVKLVSPYHVEGCDAERTRQDLFYISTSKHLTSFELKEYTVCVDLFNPETADGHPAESRRMITYSSSDFPRLGEDRLRRSILDFTENHERLQPYQKLASARGFLSYILEESERCSSRER